MFYDFIISHLSIRVRPTWPRLASKERTRTWGTGQPAAVWSKKTTGAPR